MYIYINIYIHILSRTKVRGLWTTNIAVVLTIDYAGQGSDDVTFFDAFGTIINQHDLTTGAVWSQGRNLQKSTEGHHQVKGELVFPQLTLLQKAT